MTGYTAEIKGRAVKIETCAGLFSPLKIDEGTFEMLSAAEITEGGKVLDLGCGAGVVGIYAALVSGAQNVVMTDIDPKAVEYAAKNAEANGVSGVKTVFSDAYDALDDKDFDIIFSNPPYHADFSVPKKFIEKGFNRLKTGGRFFMVTKRLDWYKNKFISVFGGVKIHRRGEYFVFEAHKKSADYAKKAPQR